jgi:ribonuclease HI
MHFTIHGDGGSRGNPGPAGSGAVIRNEGGELVATVSQFLGVQTNNYAEYESVILAFQTLEKMLTPEEVSRTSVEVKMDSQLVVKQMKNEYKVKHPVMKAQHARLSQAAGAFGQATFMHVPREQNSDADALANDAMDRGKN